MAAGLSQPAEILVVYNPGAGGADQVELHNLIATHFPARRVDLCECSPADDMHARLSPWLGAGVNLVIVAGGDGTISNVASALTHTEIPMGILPMGTGNVVARELELPLDPDEAADVLAREYSTRRLDVMRVGKRAYLLSVSVGLSAEAMKEISRQEKKLFGQTAYFFPFIRKFFGTQVIEFRVELDGQSRQIRATDLLAVNIGIIGYKALSWGPEVRPDDGLMNLCYLRAYSGLDYLWAIVNFLNRHYLRNKQINCLPVRDRIRIAAPEGLPFQADGDWIGYTPVEVRLDPGALLIAVSKK
jgi:diacylglycerol kinase (ATP)